MKSDERLAEDSPQPYGVWSFGPFEFDPQTLELRRDGDAVPLEPRPARVLLALVSSDGRMVERDHLRQVGWPRLPDAADDSLNTAIRHIRGALGDRADDPSWIETLRGRGYRFVGEARFVTTDAGRRSSSARAPGVRLRLGAAALVVLAVGAGGSGSWLRSGQARPAEIREAVEGIRHRMEDVMDPGGALVLANQAVAEHPESALLHAERAATLMVLGQHTEAWAVVGRALSLDPLEPLAHTVAANLHMLGGAWDEARGAADRATKLDPESSRAWVTRAFLETVTGDFEAGARSIDRALEVDPIAPVVWGDAGLLHLWSGRTEQARAACSRAFELDPRAVWSVPCALDASLQLGDNASALVWAGRLPGAPVPDPSMDTARNLEVMLSVRVEALKQLDAPWLLAVGLVRTGDTVAALEALEAAAQRPGFGVLGIAVDPRFTKLRSDSIFQGLVRSLGLDPLT